MNEDYDKIFPSELQGNFVRFVEIPTSNGKRLVAMLKDGSKRLVKCETCGKTEHMNVEEFKNPQTADGTRTSEADKYYVRCGNPDCSGHGTGIYLTTVRENSQLLGRFRKRFGR